MKEQAEDVANVLCFKNSMLFPSTALCFLLNSYILF